MLGNLGQFYTDLRLTPRPVASAALQHVMPPDLALADSPQLVRRNPRTTVAPDTTQGRDRCC